MNTCKIDGCILMVHGRGLCNKHYRRWKRTGTTELLSHPNRNEKGQFLKGLIGEKSPYYKRIKVRCSYCKKELLKIPAHDKRAKNLFCGVKCKSKWQRGLFGKDNPKWKGGRWGEKDGYIYIYARDHPNKTHHGYVFEHRLVMEKKIGRYLKKEEHVHHLNGIKDDNRPENLVLTTNSKHDRFSYIHALQQRIRELEKRLAQNKKEPLIIMI